MSRRTAITLMVVGFIMLVIGGAIPIHGVSYTPFWPKEIIWVGGIIYGVGLVRVIRYEPKS